MHASTLKSVVEHLRKWTDPTRVRELSDADLLERFRRHREEAAFTLLLQRHGPMVLAVCRRILGDAHEAEDAFQASFLVLIRSADKIRKKHSLGSWLHGVASRVAHKARMRSARQRTQEREALSRTICDDPSKTLVARELRAALDEEIARLPDKYRAPLVLCYLADKTHEQVAGELGWPKSSVTARLARARELLQRRLRQRGFTVPAGLLAALLTEQSANATLPSLLTLSTVRLAMQVLTGETLAATTVAVLADGFVKGAATAKYTAMLTLLATLGFAAAFGTWMASSPVPSTPQKVLPQSIDNRGEKQAQTPKPHVDLFGDPLPPGARARLGTVRCRQGTSVHITQFSPDGKNLLLGGAGENGLSLWEVASGRRVLDSPIDFPNQAAISPDGKLLAVGEFVTSLWDTSSGRRVKTLDKAFGAAVAFAADGNTLAVGMEQGVNLCDVAAGKKLRHLSQGAMVRAVAFPVGGKTLVSAGEDGTVRLWDLNSGKELRRWDTDKGPRHDLAASTTEPWVALADEKTLRMFNVQTGKEIRLLGPNPYQRGAVAFSADGKLLASAHDPGQMYIWDAATGKEKLRWKTTRSLIVHTLAFSPDGNTLVSSAHDSSGVQWWDVATGKEITRPQVGHGGWVKAIGFSRDGKDLFSLSSVGDFLSWSKDGKNHARSQLPFCTGAAFAPDGKTTLSVDWDGKIGGEFVLWLRDSATGKEIRSLGKVPLANQVAFSPDGKSVALAEAEGGTLTVSVWDLMSGKPRHRFARPGNRLYFCLAFSPDGKKVAAGSWAERPNFHLWDLDTGKEIPSCDPDHWVNSITFSPDGSLVALGSGGDHKNCLSVWDLTTARELHRFAVAGMEVVSAFSPNGRYIVTGASLKSMARGPKAEASAVRVWEIATDKEVASFQGHQSSITAVAFAPDGKSLASGGGDSTILIWDLAAAAGLPSQSPLTAKELDALWADLSGDDATKAFHAIHRLTAAPEQTLPFLREHLKPVSAPDEKRIRQLVEMLDSADFPTRQKAAEELEKQNDAAAGLLRHIVAKEKPSLELRRRLQQIVESIESKSEPLRAIRAMEVLEWMATPAAVRFINELAGGAAGARLTNEAVAAKRRLQR